MATPREILILNFLVEEKTPGAVPLDQFLGRALRALRKQLGLEAALVVRHEGGGARIIEADGIDAGTLPAAELLTGSGDIGGPALAGYERLGADISFEDGTPYGSLICFGSPPRVPFNDRDFTLMRVYAEMLAEHLEADAHARSREDALAQSIRAVIAGDQVSCVYQPIIDIHRGRIVGVEALARFSVEPVRSPDAWFGDAVRAGLEIELERKVIDEALRSFPMLPDNVSVAFNVTSHILLHGRLDEAFAAVDPRRIVLEINEHMSIRQYDEIARVLAPLRSRGLQIAVDDAGRGIEGFQHILNLKPNIIKLHRTLVHQIDADPARRALAGAVVQFGRGQRCELIAEGVENAAELATLKALGVRCMQGYFLRRPAPLAAVAELCSRQQRTEDAPA